jgi:hypothetical protein
MWILKREGEWNESHSDKRTRLPGPNHHSVSRVLPDSIRPCSTGRQEESTQHTTTHEFKTLYRPAQPPNTRSARAANASPTNARNSWESPGAYTARAVSARPEQLGFPVDTSPKHCPDVPANSDSERSSYPSAGSAAESTFE